MWLFNLFGAGTELLKRIVERGAKTTITDKQFLEAEIKKFKRSEKRKWMIKGDLYYGGDHDILKRKRTMIGEDGLLKEVENLPNNRIIDNQYSKLVDQKVNYLLTKPPSFNTENKQYGDALKMVFNKRFLRSLKNLGEDSLNGGIAWLHPYYNAAGELAFKKFAPYEILPFWQDDEHTVLDAAVRLYEVEAYEGQLEKIIEKVEVYTPKGIDYYILRDNVLIPDVEREPSPHIIVTDDKGTTGWNWQKIPLIPFKYNNKELPLIKRVKSLQDAINTMLSDFENNMQEDARNTILVIKNYDGTNLGEFRKNLATFGAVKVRTAEGGEGGIDTLTIEVNADNYKVILEVLKKAIIENGRGYDAKDDRMSGNPNQMNIQSMYSDIDLDANGMETEYQAAFEDLLWFVKMHLSNSGEGNFEHEVLEIIFDRDILINESETITNCKASVGIISDETIVAQHPWISDPEDELAKIKKQKEADLEEMQQMFPPKPTDPNADSNKKIDGRYNNV